MPFGIRRRIWVLLLPRVLWSTHHIDAVNVSVVVVAGTVWSKLSYFLKLANAHYISEKQCNVLSNVFTRKEQTKTHDLIESVIHWTYMFWNYKVRMLHG